MRAKHALASLAAAAFIFSGAEALAANDTVTLTVPVDVSAMPYVATVSVQCMLLDTMDEQGFGGPSFNRVDKPLANGEFHGSVSMSLTAAQGHAPVGYRCKLYLFAAGSSTGFIPVAPGDAIPSTPKEDIAAPNTPLVTMVQGTFGPSRVMHLPGLMTH